MKNLIIALIIVVLIIGGALYILNKNSISQPTLPSSSTGSPETAPVTAPVTSPAKSLQITLNMQNNSGQSGTATLTDVNGQTKVDLSLTGEPANISEPAHIHTGSCANLGGVKYALNFPRNGQSETMLNISLDQLLQQLPLAVNVHKSAAEINVYYACGDIASNANNNNSPAATVTPPTANPATSSPTPVPSSGGYGY